jgi:hypothetical protein
MQKTLLVIALSLLAFSRSEAQWERIDTNGLPGSGDIIVSSVVATDVAVHVTTGLPAALYRSSDDGDSWVRVDAVPAASFGGATVLGSGATVIVQDQDPRLFVSTDHGVTWAERPATAPLDIPVLGLARVETAAGRSHAFVSNADPNRLYVTHDDFATFEAVLPEDTIQQVVSNGRILIAVSGFSQTARYYRSIDGGRTWSTTPSPLIGAVAPFAASDSLFVAGTAVTGGGKPVLHGGADGSAFPELAQLSIALTIPVEADPAHSAVFSYGASRFALSVRNGRDPVDITSSFPSQLFGTTRFPCHQTTSGFNRAITSRYAYALATCNDTGAGVFGALYRYRVTGAVTAAPAAGYLEISRIGLGSPAPTPIRDEFVLSFTLPGAGHARLALYDALGRHIGILAEGDYASGRTELRLDAGMLVPGSYLLRLESGDGMVTRAVIVQ